MHPRLTLALILALTPLSLPGETVKDRAAAVRDDRWNMEKSDRWIYNDWRGGLEKAKSTGKPLLVVLRCVPCLACMGIDTSVLTEPELEPLLRQFVCVRVMNANALDLSLFQFDYDLSFSTLFFNGDGTIYGRFGSWTHQKNSQDKTIAGYKRTLEAVLAVHRGYPANRESLKGKQGGPMPVKDPLELPDLAGKYKRELDWEGKVVQSCVHCHQIGDGMRSYYRDKNQPIPSAWIYPMPEPETLGITLAADYTARVQAVAEQSIARKAGFQAGDEFLTFGGQSILSSADFSWVLHQAQNSGSLTATVKRGATERVINVALPTRWRAQSDISGRVGTWGMRAMALGGMLLVELSPEARSVKAIPKTQMALLVKHAGEYGKHAAAKKAGFKKDDILVELDGSSLAATESDLIDRLLGKYSAGDKVKAVVLRDGDRIELSLPMQ